MVVVNLRLCNMSLEFDCEDKLPTAYLRTEVSELIQDIKFIESHINLLDDDIVQPYRIFKFLHL